MLSFNRPASISLHASTEVHSIQDPTFLYSSSIGTSIIKKVMSFKQEPLIKSKVIFPIYRKKAYGPILMNCGTSGTHVP